MAAPRPVVHVVDDDASYLKAIARLLRAAGFEVATYDAAEPFLAREPRDGAGCVLCDLSMPGMDGADLLARVKEISPDCVRLILSGHSDTASIMKTVGTAHQYLNKPCDPELLKRTIKRAYVG